MKKLPLVFLLIAGCTTMGEIQAPCFSKYTLFSDVTACIRTEMPRLKSNPKWGENDIHQYETYMELLEQKVKNRELSDIDAKMRLQEHYTQIRAAK